jgi:hypothetical protein
MEENGRFLTNLPPELKGFEKELSTILDNANYLLRRQSRLTNMCFSSICFILAIMLIIIIICVFCSIFVHYAFGIGGHSVLSLLCVVLVYVVCASDKKEKQLSKRLKNAVESHNYDFKTTLTHGVEVGRDGKKKGRYIIVVTLPENYQIPQNVDTPQNSTTQVFVDTMPNNVPQNSSQTFVDTQPVGNYNGMNQYTVVNENYSNTRQFVDESSTLPGKSENKFTFFSNDPNEI